MPPPKKLKRSILDDADEASEALLLAEYDLGATEAFLEKVSFNWLCCETCKAEAARFKNIQIGSIENHERVKNFLRLLQKSCLR